MTLGGQALAEGFVASSAERWHSSEHKAFRGGSWGYLPKFIRTTDRARNSPTYAGLNLGFRCAAPAALFAGGDF